MVLRIFQRSMLRATNGAPTYFIATIWQTKSILAIFLHCGYNYRVLVCTKLLLRKRWIL